MATKILFETTNDRQVRYKNPEPLTVHDVDSGQTLQEIETSTGTCVGQVSVMAENLLNKGLSFAAASPDQDEAERRQIRYLERVGTPFGDYKLFAEKTFPSGLKERHQEDGDFDFNEMSAASSIIPEMLKNPGVYEVFSRLNPKHKNTYLHSNLLQVVDKNFVYLFDPRRGGMEISGNATTVKKELSDELKFYMGDAPRFIGFKLETRDPNALPMHAPELSSVSKSSAGTSNRTTKIFGSDNEVSYLLDEAAGPDAPSNRQRGICDGLVSVWMENVLVKGVEFAASKPDVQEAIRRQRVAMNDQGLIYNDNNMMVGQSFPSGLEEKQNEEILLDKNEMSSPDEVMRSVLEEPGFYTFHVTSSPQNQDENVSHVYGLHVIDPNSIEVYNPNVGGLTVQGSRTYIKGKLLTSIKNLVGFGAKSAAFKMNAMDPRERAERQLQGSDGGDTEKRRDDRSREMLEGGNFILSRESSRAGPSAQHDDLVPNRTSGVKRLRETSPTPLDRDLSLSIANASQLEPAHDVSALPTMGASGALPHGNFNQMEERPQKRNKTDGSGRSQAYYSSRTEIENRFAHKAVLGGRSPDDTLKALQPESTNVAAQRDKGSSSRQQRLATVRQATEWARNNSTHGRQKPVTEADDDSPAERQRSSLSTAAARIEAVGRRQTESARQVTTEARAQHSLTPLEGKSANVSKIRSPAPLAETSRGAKRSHQESINPPNKRRRGLSEDPADTIGAGQIDTDALPSPSNAPPVSSRRFALRSGQSSSQDQPRYEPGDPTAKLDIPPEQGTAIRSLQGDEHAKPAERSVLRNRQKGTKREEPAKSTEIPVARQLHRSRTEAGTDDIASYFQSQREAGHSGKGSHSIAGPGRREQPGRNRNVPNNTVVIDVDAIESSPSSPEIQGPSNRVRLLSTGRRPAAETDLTADQGVVAGRRPPPDHSRVEPPRRKPARSERHQQSAAHRDTANNTDVIDVDALPSTPSSLEVRVESGSVRQRPTGREPSDIERRAMTEEVMAVTELSQDRSKPGPPHQQSGRSEPRRQQTTINATPANAPSSYLDPPAAGGGNNARTEDDARQETARSLSRQRSRSPTR